MATGSISAFRFHFGRVDMKMRYIETERYRLERNAPCVRGAIDSAANTNLVYWAGHLLALKEIALPYAVDPDTLATLKYDPFGSQVCSRTFTAYPKIDPFTNELVVYGYEATGLASLDVVTYTLDSNGTKVEEEWLKAPWSRWAPLGVELQAPRQPSSLCLGGKARSALLFGTQMKNVGFINGKTACLFAQPEPGRRRRTVALKFGLKVPASLGMPFHFFPPDDGRTPATDAKCDFVRWELDLNAPSRSSVPDPRVILDLPCKFPRIDERSLTKQYNIVFLDNLNGLAMHDHRSGETRIFCPGDNCAAQEPVFIPRSEDAPEGDGWVLAMVEQKAANRCDVVVLDTAQFEKPIAVVQLPFHVKAQVHGNWVDSTRRKGTQEQGLVHEPDEKPISGRGALAPVI
ncbi:hypothetical protein Asppvi_008436 [Aspergillus pseudoviridinutans]|uniref:Carotenoid oxygenase n=1 Tax=Aspergillus pseudoviridinutans TaxID=1517512 RepID=A0A9P3BG21_9EURO|nr:uncharacterized protein Asppvi_008436 [Aspergillus pseudoviridinutans]GIJ89494.1 hypothetical protein Asppvi_008436 [Aspergillus pseudoviridinutans]